MENIIIKTIVEKPSGLVIIGYNGNREATLNTKWQSQEVDYLQKDVGIGGSVDVEVVVKGQYTNITKVNFESAKKNGEMSPENQNIEAQVTGANAPQETVGLLSQKDIQIISQCLTKAWVQTTKEPKEILEAYRYFQLELEQNG